MFILLFIIFMVFFGYTIYKIEEETRKHKEYIRKLKIKKLKLF